MCFWWLAEREYNKVGSRASETEKGNNMNGIPLEEDLSIFARAQKAYTARATSKNKAIAILAMRVVIERARPPFTTKPRAAVIREYVQRIIDEPEFCRSLACWRTPGVALNWPDYKDTGLIT